MPLLESSLPDAPQSLREAFLDPLLASLLCCPACDNRPSLRVAPEESGAALVCPSCGRTYPIKNGVPYLLVEDGGGEKPKSGGIAP